MFRSGRSPKRDSAVGFTHCSNTWRTVRRSSIRRMCPSQFQRWSLARRTMADRGLSSLVGDWSAGYLGKHFGSRCVQVTSYLFCQLPGLASVEERGYYTATESTEAKTFLRVSSQCAPVSTDQNGTRRARCGGIQGPVGPRLRIA